MDIALSKTHRAIFLAFTSDRRRIITAYPTQDYPYSIKGRAEAILRRPLSETAFAAGLDRLVDIGLIAPHHVRPDSYEITRAGEEYVLDAVKS